MPDLSGKICLVTGASRGIGRGVALQLVTHGATCYITGRKMKDLKLVEDEMKSRGLTGTCISVECDHSCDNDVENLFKQIGNEQNGQLDLLVNNAFSGASYTSCNKFNCFWDQDAVEGWDIINSVGLRGNYICAVYAARLMVPRRKGLIINISSIGGKVSVYIPQYGVGKAGLDRMARDCAFELSKYNVAFLSLWPGLVKTSHLTKIYDDVVKKEKLSNEEEVVKCYYTEGESPEFPGKCIVHLLEDPKIMSRSGQIHLTTDLGCEFSLKDVDGSTPVGQRSVRLMAMMTPGFVRKLSAYVPSWIKIPKSIYFMMLGFVKSSVGKTPSRFE